MIQDVDHWDAFGPPYSPNSEEVAVFKGLIGDKKPVYLLGVTPSLLPLADVAVDLALVKIDKPLIQCNWWDLKDKSGVIIGDGVLNLCGLGLVSHLMKLTEKLICRVFLKKLPKMKYATFFPTEFHGCKEVIYTQKDIAIVIWEL